jgi:iron complex transport system ATP-binding protein
MSALLEARDLRISVPDRVLVDRLNFTVARGEFIALLGGNGTGKSLLLRTLAGLRPPDKGLVALAGRDIHSLTRRDVACRLGFLPQDPEAAPQGTVRESALLGRFAHLGLWEAATESDAGRVTRALADVGLSSLASRELGSLSGGEQRRAAIARLLVQAPLLYLLDEPTNHLDPAQQISVLNEMRKLAGDGAAVIASLHEPNLALRFADRIGLLDGQGGVDIVETPLLAAAHLERLYGLRYAESRIASQRLMTPLG